MGLSTARNVRAAAKHLQKAAEYFGVGAINDMSVSTRGGKVVAIATTVTQDTALSDLVPGRTIALALFAENSEQRIFRVQLQGGGAEKLSYVVLDTRGAVVSSGDVEEVSPDDAQTLSAGCLTVGGLAIIMIGIAIVANWTTISFEIEQLKKLITVLEYNEGVGGGGQSGGRIPTEGGGCFPDGQDKD